MKKALDPFQFIVIAVAGWMNQRQARRVESPGSTTHTRQELRRQLLRQPIQQHP
jgi:hypothetical protein